MSSEYSSSEYSASSSDEENTRNKGRAAKQALTEDSEDDISDMTDGANDLRSENRPAAKQSQKKKKEKTIEERYQKKTQLEHILLRPDTYVGSLEPDVGSNLWVWDENENRMICRPITYIPAMYKIFDEILVNAADVKARETHESRRAGSQRMTKIDVTINPETGCISVANDGQGIPVEIHKEHGIYVPELIFGHLLTSDNYDDTDQRVTGGRNGFGAKLTNIFSSEFSVEVIDSVRKRKFQMSWKDNMSWKSEPKVFEFNRASDSVKVSFQPDFKRFKVSRLDDDLLSLMKKRVYDIAGTTGVKATLNGKKLEVTNFKTYVDLYFRKPVGAEGRVKSEDASEPSSPNNSRRNSMDESDATFSESDRNSKKSRAKGTDAPRGESEGVLRIHEKSPDGRWEVVVSQSDGQFQQVSFVNSICTTKGGTHVSHVIDPMVNAILKKVSTKNKGGIEIRNHHVRAHIFVFVNALIVNPAFDSQTKETLTTKPSQFGSSCSLSDKTMNAIVKSSITETVLLWAQTKLQVDLKRKMKAGGSTGRRDRLLGMPKLEDANDAGTRHAHECTLILTEGESAKTSCIAGLSIVGKDRYGVFPLRGKLLNVRDATFKQLTENKEIQSILTITGLEVGKEYESVRGLRYGSIMIMTDQDHDGSHIKGLLINLFHLYWPNLLKIPGFLREFITPIVKATRRNETLNFFSIPEYEAWKKSIIASSGDGLKGWKVKYYKGLGTSDDKEFKEYFSDLNRHILDFNYEGSEDFELIDMAFNPKRVDDRKNWLRSFNTDENSSFYLNGDQRAQTISYKQFINNELILFSKYDLERSIPSIIDGLKPGQRKVLFGVFKKNLIKAEMKVAQLASYVAEHSAYHHGEESLVSTIINMAQNFVGSNNLNLLQPCGQFGSRKEGGKDASAGRYIYTRLSTVARALFPSHDDQLLHYNNEEGRVIEPKYYLPVIPLVLVNGAEGIGTGWSSSVPNHNPRDIIENIRAYIRNQPLKPMRPWYRGFVGSIVPNSKLSAADARANETSEAGDQPTGTQEVKVKGFESVGKIEKIDDETLHISELPVKFWTQPYKEFLEELMTAGIEQEAAAKAASKRPASAKPSATSAAGSRAGAKAGAKRVAGAKTTAARGAFGRPKVHKVTILDFRDNCTHESISFTIKLDPAMLQAAEAEGLEKVFRLRKAIPVTNMTLHNCLGNVTKYESELDILREFAKLRLEFYHRRKTFLQNLLERELCIISNRLKFIVEVVNGSLVVQKKSRLVLVNELKQRGFDPMSRIDKKFDTHNPTMQGEVDDDGVVRDPDAADTASSDASVDLKAKDFDYLVGMSMWSLTNEKVEDLRKQAQTKEKELEEFKRKTPEDLWEDDLKNLEEAISQFEQQLHEQALQSKALQAKSAKKGSSSLKGFDAKPKRQAAKRAKVKKEEHTNSVPSVSAISMFAMSTSAGSSSSNLTSAADTKGVLKSPERDFSLMARLREKLAAGPKQATLVSSFAKKPEEPCAPSKRKAPSAKTGAKKKVALISDSSSVAPSVTSDSEEDSAENSVASDSFEST